MSTETPPRLEGPGVVSLREGRTWTLDALDGVTMQLTERHQVRAGARLVSEAPWWEPSGLCAAWLGLSLGCEVHVGLNDEELHRLGPDVECPERSRRAPDELGSGRANRAGRGERRSRCG